MSKSKQKRRMKSGLLSASRWVVQSLGALFMLFLTWYSLRFTIFMYLLEVEESTEIRDSVWQNLLILAAVILLGMGLFVLENRMSQRLKEVVSAVLLIGVLACVCAMSVYWINIVERVPVGDQAFVYDTADRFLMGDYGRLDPGGYLSMYPYQAGLVLVMQGLFLLVGLSNFKAFMWVNIGFVLGIIVLGYLILLRMSKAFAPRVIYLLMSLCCVPLVFYTSWVYGDLGSIFFMLLAIWCFLSYRGRNGWWLAGMVLSMCIAVMFRYNSVILSVAFALVGFVLLILKFDRKLAISLVLVLVLPLLLQKGIHFAYRQAAGVEKQDSIPFSGTLYMAVGENPFGQYGGYDHERNYIFYNTGDDAAASDAIYKEEIRKRLNGFAQNKPYALVFWRGKILQQWNSPFYQSFFFSNENSSKELPAPDTLLYFMYSTDGFPWVRGLVDRLQFVVYVGFFLFFLLGMGKRDNIYHWIIPVLFIGGFLFSILWEAKARYVFPYYVAMLPLAALVYGQLLQVFYGKMRERISEKKGN